MLGSSSLATTKTAATKKKTTKPTRAKTTRATTTDVLSKLRAAATKKDFANLARFGIAATKDNAYGVSMASLLRLAKGIGVDHQLALGLWKSGVYEARMLATAEGLAADERSASARWVGKDALRELRKPAALRRVSVKTKKR